MDSRLLTRLPENKENLDLKAIEEKNKCDSHYIKNISLQKNRLFYENKRKLSSSLKGHRSLNRAMSDQRVSFSKYVQSNVRQWGAEIEPEKANQTLAERFLKPMKYKLK